MAVQVVVLAVVLLVELELQIKVLLVVLPRLAIDQEEEVVLEQ
jgi:hypothetical protein